MCSLLCLREFSDADRKSKESPATDLLLAAYLRLPLIQSNPEPSKGLTLSELGLRNGTRSSNSELRSISKASFFTKDCYPSAVATVSQRMDEQNFIASSQVFVGEYRVPVCRVLSSLYWLCCLPDWRESSQLPINIS